MFGGSSVSTCHNCRIGPSAVCFNCKRIEHDDIRRRHGISSDEHEKLAAASAAASYNRHAADNTDTGERSTTTGLPPEVEDVVRRWLYDVLDLRPFDLLLLAHVRRGGSPATFGLALADFVKSLSKYGDRSRKAEWHDIVGKIGPQVSRQTATTAWASIVSRVPTLGALRTWPSKPRQVKS